MIKHKIKLAIAFFVVSTAYFSGATLPADAIPFCHELGNGSFILLDTNDNGFSNGHFNDTNDLLGQDCLVALCPVGQIFDVATDMCVALPTISINDVSQVEGDIDNTFTFTITRTGITDTAISVNYDTFDGPAIPFATEGSDYVGIVSGTALIANGATSTTVDITVKGDTDVEPDEKFTITLSFPTGATIVDGQGLGIIENDDVPPPLECPPGTHEENGECIDDEVPPPLECPPGTHEENEVCVQDELVCDEGFVLIENECVSELESEPEPKITPIPDPNPDPESEDNDGGFNAWDSRPTFGVSHETREDIIVDNGFRFNGESFAVVDNHHTPFDEQIIELGAVNSFAATVYADKDLKVQEFLFGIPEVGMGHLAEMRVEVWFDNTGEIQDVKVNQDSEIIDRASLIVTHQKSKCQAIDIEENCDTTFMSAVFLEPLKDNVMAIKAMDFKLRDQTTYLNDGFDVSGDSLNPMNTKMIPSTVKYEGLIKVTQNEKYSKYWTTDDGRVFEMNSFDSFKQVNQEFKRFQDSGEPLTRQHSGFASLIEFEAERALKVFDSTEIYRDCNFIQCY